LAARRLPQGVEAVTQDGSAVFFKLRDDRAKVVFGPILGGRAGRTDVVGVNGDDAFRRTTQRLITAPKVLSKRNPRFCTFGADLSECAISLNTSTASATWIAA
jgi:hypothetical protein